jgi:hypothetical protein
MNVVHVGWCKDGTHDKVWGVISLADPSTHRPWDESKFVTFWGRRGKTLRTKIETTTVYQVRQAFENKLDKGYREIKISDLETVYPEFRSDLEKTAIWSILRI